MEKNLDFDLAPYRRKIRERVIQAYEEDVGSGDVTSNAVLKPMRINAVIIAKGNGVLAGALEARALLDHLGIKAKTPIREGAAIRKGDVLLRMSGDARRILSAERTLLNFMGRLSGIATATSGMAGKSRARIAATRKTLLGFSDKRAVRIGGGVTHRLGLFGMHLIKDNHIDIVCRELGCPRIKAIGVCIRRARARKDGKMVEIEVRDEKEAIAAIREKPDVMMIDGAKPEVARRIAKLVKGTGMLLEVSGGVNLSNIRKFGNAGADYVSSGALTNSCHALDMSLEVL